MSKAYPSRFSGWPAARASSRPASVRSTSVQPVKRFSLFHWLSPWRRSTSLYMEVGRRNRGAAFYNSPSLETDPAVQFFVDNIFLFAIAFASGAMLLWPMVRARAAGPALSSLEATRLINSKNAQVIDIRNANDFA